ncbi:MAG: putative O-glycosylation ligase, exosortase A system-associated [Pseudomonadota bacterium]
MRNAALIAVVAFALALALRYPFLGVLTWAWFTLMTPHQLAFGVYGIPINLVIAIGTITAIALHGGFRNARIDTLTGLVCAFAVWVAISQVFSLDHTESALYTDRFIKTLAFCIICSLTAIDRLRIHALVWLLAIALGFFAAKGAAFTLATLGQYRVQGIENTVLEDNNHMGVALATVLPVLLYLRGAAAQSTVKQGVTGVFAATLVSILGTHSRGAFLSLLAFCSLIWLRTQRKLAILGGLVVVLVPMMIFMPSKWFERMATIGEATQDASFMGRVDAWVINWKLALQNPVTGGGLRNSYNEVIAAAVDPSRAESAKAAHSIYFEVLGGTGFVGLALLLAILITAYRRSGAVAAKYGDQWSGALARQLQTALVIFCIGGASVSMEMWDGLWLLVALIASLERLTAGKPVSAPTPIREKARPQRPSPAYSRSLYHRRNSA